MQRAQTIINHTKHDEILIDVAETNTERTRLRSHNRQRSLLRQQRRAYLEARLEELHA